MHRKFFPLCAALLLFGQGCFAPPEQVSLDDVRVEALAAPDGVVAFREGFGKLPGSAPSYTSAAQPTVVLDADLPLLPPDVTVLREWDTAPDTNLLRNLTTAIGVPSGAFGVAPHTDALTLLWRDGAGYTWTYEAPAHALRAERLLPAASPFAGTAEGLANTRILATVDDFIAARGIDTAGWGVPAVHTSSSGAWRVTYAASRDEHAAFSTQGHSILAGSVEGVGESVMRASLELPRSLDRSNYPALAQGEVLRRLRAGGTNPLPPLPEGSSVSFDAFQTVLYRHEGTVAGKTRVFYVPALHASGMLRQGGTLSPYTTLVPLATDASFERSPSN